MSLFRSKLFLRAFPAILAVVFIFTASIYLYVTQVTDSTVEQIEMANGWTVLDNVNEIVSQAATEQDAFEQSVLAEKKRILKTAVDLADSFIRSKLKEAKRENLSADRAKDRILSELRDFRYGNNDYIWAADYQSYLISHPSDELHGKDASNLVDINGNQIVAPMVERARIYGDGYYSYWWSRLEGKEPSEKLSYFRTFPSLAMVIGSGFYLDDLREELARRKAASLARLRGQISNIKIANTGYLYIFDGNDRMIVHPNSNLDGKDAGDLLEPVSKQPILKMLKKVADNPEGLNYKWDKPDDPGNYVYDKVSWVRYFPNYDWYIAASVYRDELHTGSRHIGKRIMLISLVFLVASTALGYLFVRSLAIPIIRLSQTARQVREGDLFVSSNIKRDDEIGELVQSFNAMVERLREDIEQLDSRVMSRTQELRTANKRLQEIDRMKSDFMSSVSHEFRTPMTAIRGFLAIIRREFHKHFAPLAGDDERLLRKRKIIEGDLEIVEQESLRLENLIQNVLDFTELLSGHFKWKDGVFGVRELVDQAVAAVEERLAEKPDLSMTVDCPAGLPEIMGDKEIVARALANLLDNAVKFTDTGQVLLRAGLAEDGAIRISVRDTGPGIPDDQLAQIFTHFHQVLNDDHLVDKPKGTGLGLSMSKLIIERHGGKIGVFSKLGEGCEFVISLPRAPAGGQAA